MKISRLDWIPLLAIAAGAAVGTALFDAVEEVVEDAFDHDEVHEVVGKRAAPKADVTWSPDGRWIVFREDGEPAMVRRAPTPEPEPLRLRRVEPEAVVDADGRHRIRITGTSSLERTPSPQPVIYVDGVRLETGTGIDDIEPSTIDRIEILKNGAAVELYGEEAAGGVVQIFLKKKIEAGGP